MVNYPTASRRKLSIGAADPPGLAIRPGSGSGEVYGPTRSMGVMPPADVLAQLSPQEMAPPPTPYPKPRSLRKDAPGGALAFILGSAFGGLRGGASAAAGYLGGAQQAADADYQRQLAQYEDEWKRQQAAWKQSLDMANLDIRQGTLDETISNNAANRAMAGKRLDLDTRSLDTRIAQWGKDADFRERRAGVADSQWQAGQDLRREQFTYGQGRDQVLDARDARDFGYRQGRDQVLDAQFDKGLMQKNFDHWFNIYTAPTGEASPQERKRAAGFLRQIAPLLGVEFNGGDKGDPFLARPTVDPLKARAAALEERRVSISEGGLALDRSREGRAARKDALAEADRPKPTDMISADQELIAANQMLATAQGELKRAEELLTTLRAQATKKPSDKTLQAALSQAIRAVGDKQASVQFYAGRLERAKSDRADLQRRRGR